MWKYRAHIYKNAPSFEGLQLLETNPAVFSLLTVSAYEAVDSLLGYHGSQW